MRAPLLLAAVAIASVSPAPGATFDISPAAPLMDERVTIRISGLPPHRLTLVRMRSADADGRVWRSAASYTSDPDGRLDLSRARPVSGAYDRVDGMGLFWSMQGDDRPKGIAAFFTWYDPFAPVIVEGDVSVDNRVLGSVRIERRFAAAAVRARPIGENGLVGVLYDPGDGQEHPGILILGGSEGGFGHLEAAMFASRGFTALSLGYFGSPGLPATLQSIPIEYFRRGADRLSAEPRTQGRGIAIYGSSRGAEAALLTASYAPELKAVIARAPSHVAWEGLTANRMPGGAAWSYGGKPLPYVPNRIGPAFAARYVWCALTKTPLELTPMFLHSLSNEAAVRSALIAVDRIAAPVLLISGGDDRIWPAAAMAERIVEARKRAGRPVEHVSYPSCGHWTPEAYVPVAGRRDRMRDAIGGTPAGAADAQADAWPKMLRFLRNAGL